ncbi:TIGR04283 family arsenosugar biosynthesis glycosyltransferase [Rhodonellum sp.]|uniref:TIGR04283 family arsenosugar biosynthesis glycosyltransferase n=1 Tax=Rhodonellum sp. TaxID=2231180 RepID=UPI002728E7B6|nr:TIGR04283 family arsenosugar biosynthesis glycosyltransferase [Rhodonellum sp.]MDO9553845.1 TIGR04283 family arsenosugar biosynthesis glycosyltransferase [Rhodonellum sp.]
MRLSIIIPVLDESENLQCTIPTLFKIGGSDLLEIIVVDGGSRDESKEIARTLGAKVLNSEVRSRAAQMNLGAKYAQGEILYFVHADVRLVPGFVKEIQNAISVGYAAGCFRYRFDSPKLMLRINSWFTRFNGLLVGGGDQTLFIGKSTFNALGGFDEHYTIMEDFDLVRKIKRKYTFRLLPKSILVSARKYETNSWLRVQWANLVAFLMFFLKIHPQKIKSTYKRMLDYR